MTQNVGTNYEAVTGSKRIFFLIFLTFDRDTANYRGTLVENAKMSKINPPYCIPTGDTLEILQIIYYYS
jgi:hypothetical protein